MLSATYILLMLLAAFQASAVAVAPKRGNGPDVWRRDSQSEDICQSQIIGTSSYPIGAAIEVRYTTDNTSVGFLAATRMFNGQSPNAWYGISQETTYRMANIATCGKPSGPGQQGGSSVVYSRLGNATVDDHSHTVLGLMSMTEYNASVESDVLLLGPSLLYESGSSPQQADDGTWHETDVWSIDLNCLNATISDSGNATATTGCTMSAEWIQDSNNSTNTSFSLTFIAGSAHGSSKPPSVLLAVTEAQANYRSQVDKDMDWAPVTLKVVRH